MYQEEKTVIDHINENYDPRSVKVERAKGIAVGKVVTDKITGQRTLVCMDLLNNRLITKILN